MKTDGNSLFIGILDQKTPFLAENVDLYQNNVLLLFIEFRNK